MKISSITRQEAEQEFDSTRPSKYQEIYDQIKDLHENGCIRVESEDKADSLRITQSIRQWFHRYGLSDKYSVHNSKGTIYIMLKGMILALVLAGSFACASGGSSVQRYGPYEIRTEHGGEYTCVGDLCRQNRGHVHNRNCKH